MSVKKERVFYAVSRLTAWLRDYGRAKSAAAFCEDVEVLIAAATSPADAPAPASEQTGELPTLELYECEFSMAGEDVVIDYHGVGSRIVVLAPEISRLRDWLPAPASEPSPFFSFGLADTRGEVCTQSARGHDFSELQAVSGRVICRHCGMLEDAVKSVAASEPTGELPWAWAVVDPQCRLRTKEGDRADYLVFFHAEDARLCAADCALEEGDEPGQVVPLLPAIAEPTGELPTEHDLPNSTGVLWVRQTDKLKWQVFVADDPQDDTGKVAVGVVGEFAVKRYLNRLPRGGWTKLLPASS
jgi:hypothetical protein